MAISLAQLKENTVNIPIKYNNLVANVKVAVERLDADLLDKIGTAEKSGDTQGLRLLLSSVIDGWDLYAETEGDFPPNAENIGKCPILFLNLLVKSVFELVNGNPQ